MKQAKFFQHSDQQLSAPIQFLVGQIQVKKPTLFIAIGQMFDHT